MDDETIRLIFTYSIALAVIVGGGLLLYHEHERIPAEDILPFLTFAFGLVLGYVFNRTNGHPDDDKPEGD